MSDEKTSNHGEEEPEKKGLDVKVEAAEKVKHRDGGDESSSRKSPGRTEYESR